MRLNVWRLATATGMLGAALTAATPAARAAGPADGAVAAQKERMDAMVRGDVDALARLLPDDFVYTHASGVRDTKDSLIASIKSGRLKYKKLDPGTPKTRVFGDTAVLTGVANVQAVSATVEAAPFDILYTDVYVKRPDGHWQCVAWQSTRPPAPATPAPAASPAR